MKQRLLLALLMLLTSAGFLKAQGDNPIEITVPKDAKVTITLTSSSFIFTSKSYPQLYNSGNEVVNPDGGVDKLKSKTVKWILEPGATTNYKLSTLTNNNDDWGGLTLSLDGKVTSFVVSGAATNKFQKLITSLSFTNNGELKELVLAKDQAHETTGLPNLKELSCPGNKLTWIPKKTAAMTKYEIGTQTPENIKGIIATPVNSNSKNGVTLNISKLSSNGNSTLFNSLLDPYAFTIANA